MNMEASHSFLRELTPKEVIVNSRRASFNFLKLTRICSKTDLYANLDQVCKAIITWKSMNKLLNAKVVKIDNKYCFVLNNDYLNSELLQNIHFLRILDKKSVKADPEVVWRLIEEKCYHDWIDFEKEHDCLWKMIFLEVGKEGNDFVYEMIWQIHHIIGDGRNANSNVVWLLDIIQKTLKGEKVEILDFELYQGTEKIFENEINSINNRVQVPKILRPTFIDPEKAKQTSFRPIPNQSEIDFDLLDVRSGQIYAKYNELLDISKNWNSLKPIYFILGRDFASIHKACKKEGVKLTAFFHAAISIALLRVFKEYDWQQDKLVYFTPVSLRQYKSEMDVLIMGYCVGGLLSVLDVDFSNVLDDNETMGKFWSIAREMNGSLHKRIDEENEKFQFQFSRIEQPEKELTFHYLLSNPGVVDTKCLKDFRIENMFSTAYIRKENSHSLCTHTVNTVGGKICWTVSFNSYFIQTNIIQEFVRYFQEVIFQLIPNEIKD